MSSGGLPKSVGLALVERPRSRSAGPASAPSTGGLLTTHGVDDAAEAFAVVDLYRRRWAIER